MGFLLVAAQPKSKTVPDKIYGEKGTMTTTFNTDESFNEITTIERKDDAGVVRSKSTYRKGLDGKVAAEHECFTPSGQPEFKTVTNFNEKGEMTKRVITRFDETGGIESRAEATRTPGGALQGKYTDGPYIGEEFYKEPSDVRYDEELIRKLLKSFKDENVSSYELPKNPCLAAGASCQAMVQIFGGYSYLSGENGTDNLAFPAGGHISVLYNLPATGRIGIGLDASLHSKKIGNENFTRSFIMIDGQYVFGDVDDCDRTFIPDIHVLIGLGHEKYGYSKGNGLAFGAGVGGTIRLTNNIGVKGQADFLGVKYKNTDGLNSNFRFSLGINIDVGKVATADSPKYRQKVSRE